MSMAVTDTTKLVTLLKDIEALDFETLFPSECEQGRTGLISQIYSVQLEYFKPVAKSNGVVNDDIIDEWEESFGTLCNISAKLDKYVDAILAKLTSDICEYVKKSKDYMDIPTSNAVVDNSRIEIRHMENVITSLKKIRSLETWIQVNAKRHDLL